MPKIVPTTGHGPMTNAMIVASHKGASNVLCEPPATAKTCNAERTRYKVQKMRTRKKRDLPASSAVDADASSSELPRGNERTIAVNASLRTKFPHFPRSTSVDRVSPAATSPLRDSTSRMGAKVNSSRRRHNRGSH
jgi:hypothetical protein